MVHYMLTLQHFCSFLETTNSTQHNLAAGIGPL